MSGILHNRAKCLICGDIVESCYTHDMVFCKCGQMAVDGGKAYLKRSALYPDMVEDMSLSCTNDECSDCLKNCPHKHP